MRILTNNYWMNQDVELVEAADLISGAYSGGMKRRLSTAIALTADPKIVFLDEVCMDSPNNNHESLSLSLQYIRHPHLISSHLPIPPPY